MPSLLLFAPDTPEIPSWIQCQLCPLINAANNDMGDVASVTLRSLPTARVSALAQALSDQFAGSVKTVEFCDFHQTIWLIMPGAPVKNDIEQLILMDLRVAFPNRYACSSLIPIAWGPSGRSIVAAQREVNVGFWRLPPTIKQREHPIRDH